MNNLFDVQPSIANGYARGPGESAYPDLWRGLSHAWYPSWARGFEIRDLVGNAHPTWGTGTQTLPLFNVPGGTLTGISHSGSATGWGFSGDVQPDQVTGFSHVSFIAKVTTTSIDNTTLGLFVDLSYLRIRIEASNWSGIGILFYKDGDYRPAEDGTMTYNLGYNSIMLQVSGDGGVVEGWVNDDKWLTTTTVSGVFPTWGDTKLFGYRGTGTGQRALRNAQGAGLGVLFYNRILTDQEYLLLYNDPLAPFRLSYNPSLLHIAAPGGQIESLMMLGSHFSGGMGG